MGSLLKMLAIHSPPSFQRLLQVCLALILSAPFLLCGCGILGFDNEIYCLIHLKVLDST